jgi:hypothetical protein
MSQLHDHLALTVKMSESPIGIESSGHLSMRYLTIDGKHAYDLGFYCDTCAFLFKRIDGANQTFSAQRLSGRMRKGISELSPDIVDPMISLMPVGTYQVLLLELSPTLVGPGSTNDYFHHEQIELWGINPFWGLPHFPATEYYRIPEQPRLQAGSRLFEFVIPLVPRGWLEPEDVAKYQERLLRGERATALALSVLDVKQPADWHGDPATTKHWCLAHYLLDGHHKMRAASMVGKPLTLLSFLHLDTSIATGTEVTELVQALAQCTPLEDKQIE